MVQELRARAMEPDVMRRPADAELVAPGGQLADEVVQGTVVRVTPGVRTECRDEPGGETIPFRIEIGRRRIEEREPSTVRRLLGALEHRRVEGASERIGSQVVTPDMADDGSRVDLIEQALHTGRIRGFPAGRERLGASGLAARARSKRCARSASSS